MITKLSADDVHFWNTVQQTAFADGVKTDGRGLTLEEWEQIGEIQKVPKNHLLISAEEIPDCFYIVKKGLIAGYEELANGNELIYYLMDRNAMLLEANLLLARPAAVSFRTLESAERYGVAYDDKLLIGKSVSYQMLAGLLGVNRATAVRAMHSLRDLGLIERINGFICVRSKDALKRHQELLDN